MRSTITSKLKCDRPSIQAVADFPIELEGLRLDGQTGLGKTRLAWLLIRKVAATGKTFVAFDGPAFSASASDAYRNGTEEKFFGDLTKPQILFLDDIGKGKFTARVVEALFTVVDRRNNELRPILYTMNYSLATFGSKVSATDGIDNEMVAALLRRIEERTRKITLQPK